MKNVSILTSKLPPLVTDVNAVLRRPVQRKRGLGTLFSHGFHRVRKSFCISNIKSSHLITSLFFCSEPVLFESEGTSQHTSILFCCIAEAQMCPDPSEKSGIFRSFPYLLHRQMYYFVQSLLS